MPRSLIPLAFVTVLLVALASWRAVAFVNQPQDGIHAASQLAHELYVDGDLVLVHPIAGHFELALFGDMPVVATSRVPVELERFDRIIFIELEPNPDVSTSLQRTLEREGRRVFLEDGAGFRVSIYQIRDPLRPVLDLTAQLATADVWLEFDDGRVEACPWNGERHDCAIANWVWVGPVVQMMAGQPQMCVWSHPVDQAELIIEYPSSSGGTHIDGWYGISDYAAGIHDGQRVRLTVEAGNVRRTHTAHRQRGRRGMSVRLPRDYEGPLRLTIDADSAGVRHLCWELQLVAQEGT